jgi:hypothetical protein
MNVDLKPLRPCLLTIVDALAELGQLVLEENESAATSLGEAAGTGEKTEESIPSSHDSNDGIIE